MTDPVTILMVDGAPELRSSLSELFQKEGYSVVMAESFLKALKILKADEVALMLVGVKAFFAEGYALMHIVNFLSPNLPMLILAAGRSSNLLQERPASGFDSQDPAECASSASQAAQLLSSDNHPSEGTSCPTDPHKILEQVKRLILESQHSRLVEKSLPPQSLAEKLEQLYQHGQEPQEELLPKEEAQAELPKPIGLFKFGPFVLDSQARRLTRDGQPFSLSSAAFDYLATLARYAPAPVTYDCLVRESQREDLPLKDTQDMARWRVHQLRSALEADPQHPQYILSIRNFGYRLEV